MDKLRQRVEEYDILELDATTTFCLTVVASLVKLVENEETFNKTEKRVINQIYNKYLKLVLKDDKS